MYFRTFFEFEQCYFLLKRIRGYIKINLMKVRVESDYLRVPMLIFSFFQIIPKKMKEKQKQKTETVSNDLRK